MKEKHQFSLLTFKAEHSRVMICSGPGTGGVSLWLSWLRTCLQCGRPGFNSWVQSLGWEDPLEKGKATHPSILAWRIPWTV